MKVFKGLDRDLVGLGFSPRTQPLFQTHEKMHNTKYVLLGNLGAHQRANCHICTTGIHGLSGVVVSLLRNVQLAFLFCVCGLCINFKLYSLIIFFSCSK